MTQLFESFYGELLKMGYLVKYEPYYEISQTISHQTPTILVDTREQKPLEFRWGTEIATLNFGDYSCIYRNDEGKGVEASDIFIERKSLGDFISSFGSSYKRLNSEFVRARKAGGRLVVLIESDISNALTLNGLYVPRGMRVTPDFIFHNVRDLIQEFPNVQFLFVYNRKKATEIIQKIFASKGELLKFDLQLSYEKGLI
jgi:ERCC4-type nuclease